MPTTPTAPRHLRAALTLFALLFLLPGAARAATLTVTDTSDSATDPGSLRAAVATANGDGGNDTITFSLPAGSKITLGSTLDITAPMTIQGPGASSLAIDGGNTNGATSPNGAAVFSISTSANNRNNGPGGTVTVSGLTIQNGNGYNGGYLDDGGGIVLFSGNLILTGCVLSNNTAQEGGGLAMFSTGTATVTDCTFTGNSATSSANDGFGGAVSNLFGALTMTGCTLEDNSATSQGGQGGYGGAVENASVTTLTDCTFTGNSASGGGGGVYSVLATSGDQLTMDNCTLTGNTNLGVLSNTATTLTNDIIYGDTAGSDVYVTSATVSHCDIGTGYTTGTNGNISARPRLSALGNYGGPTQTLALLPGSPCLGAGVGLSGVTADQRGVAVPQTHGYDIGAFESQGFIVYIASGAGQSAPVNTAFSQPIVADVYSRAAVAEPVVGGAVSFVAPTSGASAMFSPSPATIGSDGSVSVTATANGTVGGPYSVTAETGAGSSNPFSLTNVATLGLSVKANPSQTNYGQPVTLFATLSGGVSPTGTITFYDGAAIPANQIGTAQNVNGDSNYSVGTSSLSAGSHTITAVYSGDANNSGISATTMLTVNPAMTRLDVSASPNQSVYGQSVTLRASLSGGVSPIGGTVTFYDGTAIAANQIGSPQNVTGNGNYSVMTSSLSVANHTITAVYSGDTNNSGATNSAGENVSKDNTTTTVSCSANPSTVGQSVTFTATVAANTPGVGTPTGTVTFTIDGVAQTPVMLATVGGQQQATFSTSTLGVGPHTVRAAYNGDPDSNTSSGILSPRQQVNAATVTAVSVGWGGQTAPIPAGRDLPWLGIRTLTLTLSSPEAISPGDVSVTGVKVASYGPVTVSESGMTVTVTLAQPISAADRVTVRVGNTNVSTYTATLAVLPGDINGDGAVNAQDMVLARNAIGAAYNVLADINGDGVVDISDYNLVRARVGTKLP